MGEFRFGNLYVALGIFCFAVLGGLTGRHVETSLVPIAAFAVGCALFGLVGLALLWLLLALASPAVRKQHGHKGVAYAVGRGYLMIIPFTVLAVLAEIFLGWSAVQTFTAAGIMTAGATVGVEMIKMGGGRIRSLAFPTATAFVLSSLWMFISAMAQGVGRG